MPSSRLISVSVNGPADVRRTTRELAVWGWDCCHHINHTSFQEYHHFYSHQTEVSFHSPVVNPVGLWMRWLMCVCSLRKALRFICPESSQPCFSTGDMMSCRWWITPLRIWLLSFFPGESDLAPFLLFYPQSFWRAWNSEDGDNARVNRNLLPGGLHLTAVFVCGLIAVEAGKRFDVSDIFHDNT